MSPPRDPPPGPSAPSRPSTSAIPLVGNRPFIHVEPLAVPRMQAFASTSASSSSSRNAFSAATRKQVWLSNDRRNRTERKYNAPL